jgi:hypothetical protein
MICSGQERPKAVSLPTGLKNMLLPRRHDARESVGSRGEYADKSQKKKTIIDHIDGHGE